MNPDSLKKTTGDCILLLEDDDKLRASVSQLLEREDFRIVASDSADNAFTLIAENSVSLVLSDVVLNGKDGMTFCRDLRSTPTTTHLPVILMSGLRIEDSDTVLGLDAGADDYLPKPVSGKVLVAKIRSVLQRYRAPQELAGILRSHGLVLNVQGRVVTLKGKSIALTRKEFDLLTAFLRQPGVVLTPDYLLEAVLGIDPRFSLNEKTLSVHIAYLRDKLGEPLAGQITDLAHRGYRFEEKRAG